MLLYPEVIDLPTTKLSARDSGSWLLPMDQDARHGLKNTIAVRLAGAT